MASVYDPYAGRTDEERAAIASALFEIQLWLEDRRGWFTWMWVLGAGAIGWVWFKSSTEAGWISSNGWHAAGNVLGGLLLFVSGVALRINAALEMRHFKRLEGIAARLHRH
jgi:hypothetical protein